MRTIETATAPLANALELKAAVTGNAPANTGHAYTNVGSYIFIFNRPGALLLLLLLSSLAHPSEFAGEWRCGVRCAVGSGL